MKFQPVVIDAVFEGRLPHGRRGLKWLVVLHASPRSPRRLPHGRRGLKFGLMIAENTAAKWSPPAWEAWIEIEQVQVANLKYESPPAWEAWIEIISAILSSSNKTVASRMGGVD